MNELVIYNNASFSLLKVLQRRVEREMAILMQLYGKHERQTSKLALSALILAKLSLGSHKKKSQKCNAGKGPFINHVAIFWVILDPPLPP